MSIELFCKNVVKILSRYWKILLVEGVSKTLLLSVIAVVFGAIIGSLFAFAKMSRFRPLAWVVTAIVEVIRGTPMLLQLYIGYFILPLILPFEMGAFATVSVVLMINSGAYVSEIIRSGIGAVEKGQTEAARSLGLGEKTTMVHIVLPQAVRHILPALGNEFITVVKETSLASTFYVGELMTSYLIVKGTTYLALETLFIVGVIYFVLTFVLSNLLKLAERMLKRRA